MGGEDAGGTQQGAETREHTPELAVRDLDVRVDGGALRVRTLRQPAPPRDGRPPIVFLHDSLGCIAVWRDFPARLAAAAGCDAIVYDRRGHGASAPFAESARPVGYLEAEAEVLRAVMAACGVPEAVFFGHSDGGSIALIAAARYPALARAVITEGAHVFVEDVTLAGIRAARELFGTTDLHQRLVRHHGEKADALASAWIDTWLRPDFRAWNIEALLPQVVAPALVLQGVLDEYGSPAQVAAIAKGVGGPAESHLVRAVGHTPHRDAADFVVAATIAFLRRHGVISAP